MKLLNRKLNQQVIAPYLFLSPYFILYTIFGIFPTVFSLFLTFQKWTGTGIESMQFVGIKNIIQLITVDTFFWKTIGTTGWLLVLGSLVQHLFALPLATILNNRLLKGRDVFKTAYFLPYITSAVSISIIFNYIFGSTFGLLNQVLDVFHITKYKWLEDKNLIPVSVAIVLNWRYIGWNTIIYLAGLQAIPEEYYESAKIDGANNFKMHWHITVPLLLPIIFLGVSLSIIGGWQVFDEPYNLTGGYQNMGGTGYGGFTSAFYVMWLLQRGAQLGKGAAVCWLLFIIIIAMTLVFKLIIDRLQGDDQIMKKN